MQLTGLLSWLRQSPRYGALLQAIRAGRAIPDQHILRSARPFAVAALAHDLQRPILVVMAGVERAYNMVEQLPVWLPEQPVLRFAEPSALFYERSPWAATAIRSRLEVLSYLAPPSGSPTASQPPVMVTSALALMQHTLPVREFRASSRILRKGQTADPDKLLRMWLSIGYTPDSVVTQPGTFNRRGGILDIFPIQADQPIRLEFWGDEIESLRSFDPSTQRSAQPLEQVLIIPARETLPKLGKATAERLQGWFAGLPTVDEDVTSPQPDEGDLLSETAFPAMEFYLPYFYSRPANLLDYLPKNTLVVVDDWTALHDTFSELEQQAVQQYEDKQTIRALPVDYPLPYSTWDELRDRLRDRLPLHLAGHQQFSDLDDEGLSALTEFHDDPLMLGRLFAPSQRYGGQLKLFLDTLQKMATNQQVPVVVSNQTQRLAELWADQTKLPSMPVSFIDQPPAALTFVEGALAEGWRLHPTPDAEVAASNTPSLHVFTDAEIFGWKRPEPRRHSTPRALAPETYFADLAEGDFVVHSEYGIGRFAGLHKRLLDGTEREYLLIHYAGNDTLFVPIQQADRLTRYVGVEGQDPALNRLGSSEWSKTREAARQNAEKVAEDLLALYAQRAHVQGHAFSPDTPWQAELEASFPFIETDDQVKVLAEVKADMERSAPMDRLICGDVGYGKTEVALRAAFKAVMDGKQVAILVPTTVLAQQHFNTFSQRMATFPVKVEMLSRFRSAKEQDHILALTEAGAVDILIGTHRLLQADVKFRDLGLLIIDEEQRFGVTHKERLKRMRTEVDVLTMTATPIPRTLYMSLAGARDISTIMTPPEERLPVLTHVGPFDERLVRQAILREVDRDGQVFFVHNRVSTIDQVAQRLKRLVPEARLIIGHGQMLEDQLERVMTEFAAGQYTILLCTTIIESGLDIPNANTIIIDHAEAFGLAQLYQLRGRVGRGANRGYAYLFHPKHTPLLGDARARLETLAEQTELGAGLNIAMRDLEIRGMGELLGMRQSGYVATVGFHLYTQMLAQAVQHLKSGQTLDASQMVQAATASRGTTTTIDLPIDAYIPVDFIAEMALRLQLYRRIADISSVDMLDEVVNELTDRFGALPPALKGLLYQMRVKLLTAPTQATAITFNETQISIRLPYLASIDRNALQHYLGRDVRVSRSAVWLQRDLSTAWQKRLLEILQLLQGIVPDTEEEALEADHDQV